MRPTNVAGREGRHPGQRQEQIEDYFNGKGTRAAIAADLDRVSRWAEANHIDPAQIFVGEFGATQSFPGHAAADPADRAAGCRTRQEIEGHGFHWSLWSLTGVGPSGGMTLVSPTDENAIDPRTAAAVGKQSPSR